MLAEDTSHGHPASEWQYDPVDYSGTSEADDHVSDTLTASSSPSYERGGYDGSASTWRTDTDLAGLAEARRNAETPATRAAKLRLLQALGVMRKVCEHAMRQRMHTEMTDLAAQIRRLHEHDAPPR
ncbi:hypothetical protein [Rhodovibrio salinarum]|uniref:hypothetical protein n=1 Tax=Rhodovibrio salinarum TaxID=1087 RepID=UPI000486C0C5|nr:hypothetical protein [Rhodovibrio salinarum]